MCTAMKSQIIWCKIPNLFIGHLEENNEKKIDKKIKEEIKNTKTSTRVCHSSCSLAAAFDFF